MNRFRPYSLIRSFYCAVCGVGRSLKSERNLRIHFFAAGYVLYFSRYYGLSATEYALLLLALGAVIVCELLNTAVESAINLYTDKSNDYARIAKDAAAGAVLVSAAVAAAVGVALFWRPDILRLIWLDILSAPLRWFILLALTVFLIALPEIINYKAKEYK